MFMIVTSPWPVPSANADLAQLASSVADKHFPDVLAETGTSRPSQLGELVCWSRRERLRLLWYRFRLITSGIYRLSRQADERR
jgi:hypothetical protein